MYKTLIDLLNEYAKEKLEWNYSFVEYDKKFKCFNTYADGSVDYMTDLYVVSKRFGFIQWILKRYELWDNVSNAVIQTLAISDKPLDDLEKILKWLDE